MIRQDETRGASVDLDILLLPGDLQDRITAWSRLYGDDELPMDGPGSQLELDTIGYSQLIDPNSELIASEPRSARASAR